MVIKRTSHTVLAKISSSNLGRAKIVVGHKSLVGDRTDDFLTSSLYKSYNDGDFVKVNITLSNKRRITKNVSFFEYSGDPVYFFVNKYYYSENGVLHKEEHSYYITHGDCQPAETISTNHYVESVDNVEQLVKNEEKPVLPPTDNFYITSDNLKIFEALRNMSKSSVATLLMIGPSGYGKTAMPEYIAKKWGLKHLKWDCAIIRDPEQFFGSQAAYDGSTVDSDGKQIFVKSEFTKTIERGNCIIVLDELNRAEPFITNALFPMLDYTGKTVVAGHEIVAGPNVIVVGTVNIGYQFTGTFDLDRALANRFAMKIRVTALPNDVERSLLESKGLSADLANKIVLFATKIREMKEGGQISVDVSTRTTEYLARVITSGLDVKIAINSVILNDLSSEESRVVVDTLRTIF